MRKNPFRENQQLQLFDFIEAKFAILMVFQFFLMTSASAVDISSAPVPSRSLD
jgi:hypothetical protein